MTYLTESDVVALPLGARVSFPKGAIAYPDFAIVDPMTGTVVDKQHDATWIKIDQHHADLDEWGNLIQVWYWGDENNQAAYPMERLYSSSIEGTDMLSEFVRSYCHAHDIAVDGDAFGVAFSDIEKEWTEAEAAEVIEDTARMYLLHTPSLGIARKWVSRLGMGFHPDTSGEDYAPALSAEEIAEYDADIERMFALEGDPYESGLIAMQEQFPGNFK